MHTQNPWKLNKFICQMISSSLIHIGWMSLFLQCSNNRFIHRIVSMCKKVTLYKNSVRALNSSVHCFIWHSHWIDLLFEHIKHVLCATVMCSLTYCSWISSQLPDSFVTKTRLATSNQNKKQQQQQWILFEMYIIGTCNSLPNNARANTQKNVTKLKIQ